MTKDTDDRMPDYSPEDARDVIIEALNDQKAEDVVTVSLKGKSVIADYMIIASGRSSRHVVGLSNTVEDALARKGLGKMRVEGKENGDWVLADTGDVILHIFRPEVRAFYNIEKIWCDPDFLNDPNAMAMMKKRSLSTAD